MGLDDVPLDWGELLSLNLYLKPSACILPNEDEEEEEEEEPIDEDEDEENPKPRIKPYKPKVNWRCLSGLSSNILLLNNEFNNFRGLKPIRIFMAGPPGSGKSHHGAALAEFYNIPLIQVADVVKEVME